MKTLELPDDLAEQIERFRRRRGLSWARELESLLRQEAKLADWNEQVRRPGSKAAGLSEEEGERLATQVVREARRERRE